jgi:hypothetical protein
MHAKARIQREGEYTYQIIESGGRYAYSRMHLENDR